MKKLRIGFWGVAWDAHRMAAPVASVPANRVIIYSGSGKTGAELQMEVDL